MAQGWTAGPAPQAISTPPPDWMRPDGTMKGLGFLGVLRRPDGGVMSEYSIADSEKLKDAKGRYIDYPSLVPTLSKPEVQILLRLKPGDPVPQAIKDKAEKYALQRQAEGKPMFAATGEQQNLYPDIPRGEAPPSVATSAWTLGPAVTASPDKPSYAATVEDRAIGLGKRFVRAGQQIGNIPKVVGLPGLVEHYDKKAGLPPGSSWNATEPSNQAQAEGGQYGAALAALAAGSLAAEIPAAAPIAAGLKVVPKTVGQMAGDTLTAMGEGFVNAAKKELFGKGPITASKIGGAVAKYGVDAVKIAVKSSPAAYLAWKIWESK